MTAIFGKDNLKNGTQAALSDRFMLEIEGLDFALIESVTRPGYKIETESYQLMEYKFNYPKRVEFDTTVEVTIVELLDPEVNMTQMENVMSLPVVTSGALMPDAHQGYGMPIGGVCAVENAVIPYAVGVDIGCRMMMTVFTDTDPSHLNDKFSLSYRLQKQALKGFAKVRKTSHDCVVFCGEIEL